MRDILFLIFNEMELPFFRQGSLSNTTYPNTFFTYWNLQDTNEFANNQPLVEISGYAVYIYTNISNLATDADYLEDLMTTFKTKCRTYDLVIEWSQDIPSDRDDYIGKMAQIKYLD